MLTIKDLADSLGLSTNQVRRRLSALDGIIDNHMKRGQNQKILVDSGGLELLKRLEALREEGLTTGDAVEEITEEMGKAGSANHSETSGKLAALREQNHHLQSEIQFLREEVRRKEERIDQLLPGEVEKKSPIRRFWDWLGL